MSESQEPYVPKLVHLPGTRLTPETVLHRTLNKLPRIKAVTIVIQWDDNSMSCDSSQMKLSELLMASAVLEHAAKAELFSGEPQDRTRPA